MEFGRYARGERKNGMEAPYISSDFAEEENLFY